MKERIVVDGQIRLLTSAEFAEWRKGKKLVWCFYPHHAWIEDKYI